MTPKTAVVKTNQPGFQRTTNRVTTLSVDFLYSAWAWTFLYRRFRRRNRTSRKGLVVKTFLVKPLFSLDLKVEK